MPPILISNGGPFVVRSAARCGLIRTTARKLFMPVFHPAFSSKSWGHTRTALVLCAAALASACGPSPSKPAGGAYGGGGPPPAKVGVVTVALGDVDLMTELPGRLASSREAQVRARVTGIVARRLFQEGSSVQAGQALFQIDAAPYEAAVQSAQASLAKAEATLSAAAALAQRNKALTAKSFISEQTYLDAFAKERMAQADVVVAQAGVRTAGLSLSHAKVVAPIAGQIGRSLVSEGALVNQNEATQLAVIHQMNPMYVDFMQSASQAMHLKMSPTNVALVAQGGGNTTVRVILADGTAYAHSGKLLFSDSTVDPATGQVMLRASVPNPDGTLLSGLYVRVRLLQETVSNATLLPKQAVTRSAQGDTVMVVDAQGKVAQRAVTVAAEQSGQWVILAGLSAGEQVMVDGFQKLKGGGPVEPVAWSSPESAPNAELAKPVDSAKTK
jgi:membrane fusion protein (multidrug efflux system)